jgi:hypothetical protein
MGKCTRCGASVSFAMSLCDACLRAGEATRQQGTELPAGQPHQAQPDDAMPGDVPQRPLPRRCPLCQGANIRTDGWSGLEARVQFGKRYMSTGDTGYGLNCFACLDCGYVGHYLGPGDLQRLRSVPIMADWPPTSSRSGCGCLGMVLLLIGLGVGACVSAARLLAG